MAEYIRYDDSKALDERGRIDVVDAGASVGGGLAVREREDNSTGAVYLDIEAEKLWTAVHNGIVSVVKIEGGSGGSGDIEEGGGGTKASPTVGNTETIMLDAIISASKSEQGESPKSAAVQYTFVTMKETEYTAISGTDKPAYGEDIGGGTT